jgi:hypothetical protein
LIVAFIISASTLVLFGFSEAIGSYPTTVSNNLEFDGKTGQLMVNASFAQQLIQTNGITLSVWTTIYPKAPQGQNPIFSQSGHQFYLDAESSRGKNFTWIVWNSSAVGTYLTSPKEFTPFAWYFLAASWDARTGNMALYVDGALVGQAKGPTSISFKSSEWLVGRSDDNQSLYGKVANLQVYSGVLSPDRISALHDLGRSGGAFVGPNLLAWWKLSGDLLGYDGRISLQSMGGVEWIKSTLLLSPFDLLGVLATYLGLSSTLALLPWLPRIRTSRFLIPLQANYRPFVAAIFLKMFLALGTPLSLDFLNILHTSSFSAPPYGFSPSEGGFWFLVVHGFSLLWNILPVSHPDLQPLFRPPFSVYADNVPRPGGEYLIPFFSNEGASGLFAWVLLGKLPYVLTDIMIGLVIYQIVLKTGSSSKVASSSLVLWLLNPVSMVLIEMWTSNDSLMVLFLLSSVYTLINGRKGLSAFFYGMAIAVRLVPIVFLPVMIVALLKPASVQAQASGLGLKERIRNCLPRARIPLIISAAAIVPNLPVLFVTNLPILSVPSLQPSSILLSGSYDYFFGITFASPSVNLYGFRFGIAIILLSIYSIFVIKTWNVQSRFVLDGFIGLFLALFVLSQWNPQYWLWILPFMIMKIGYDRKYARVFLLQFLTFVIINLTMFSFYYTTSGTSVFFFPSYTPLLQGISNALFAVYNNPIFLGLRFDELLISVFAGVNIWILARLIWDRVSARVVRQFSRVAGN